MGEMRRLRDGDTSSSAFPSGTTFSFGGIKSKKATTATGHTAGRRSHKNPEPLFNDEVARGVGIVLARLMVIEVLCKNLPG